MDNYSIEHLTDKYFEDIRKLRNSQKSVLRNNKNISQDQQEKYKEMYFLNLKNNIPSEILFSIHINEKFIGYGGLVHISKMDKRCELSFLTSKKRNDNYETLKKDFNFFIKFAINFAFNSLKLNKITTETYKFRKNHIKILKNCGFINEGILKKHVFRNGKYYDSFIYSIFNS